MKQNFIFVLFLSLRRTWKIFLPGEKQSTTHTPDLDITAFIFSVLKSSLRRDEAFPELQNIHPGRLLRERNPTVSVNLPNYEGNPLTNPISLCF